MENILNWTLTWGLKINNSKTKPMVFTNKRVRDVSYITLLDRPIEHVKSYKYLGMILVAPNLKWTDHVDHIRNASLSRIIIFKTISATQWGPD